MSKAEILSKALVAILFEVESEKGDIEDLVQKTCAGLMGAKIYAPVSAEAKPKAAEALREALAEAMHYFEIQNQ